MGLRRGDCDRAGSSQPPATSGNGERCRLCRRRRGGEHARDARPASPPAAAMMGRSCGRGGAGGPGGSRAGDPGLGRRPAALAGACRASAEGPSREGDCSGATSMPRRSDAGRPKWLLVWRKSRIVAPRPGELGPPEGARAGGRGLWHIFLGSA